MAAFALQPARATASETPPPEPPVIVSFTPLEGPPGTQVTVSGSNLVEVTSILFNGVSASFSGFENGTEGVAIVPVLASTGPITLSAGGGKTTSAEVFTVIDTGGPLIQELLPSSGRPGMSIEIVGRNLTNATEVKFNGVAASFSLLGERLYASVPAAATTGPVSVATPDGVSSSPISFTVLAAAAPAISTFSPAQGEPGNSVQIRGTNLSGATSVTFNGRPATYVIFTGIILATVPQGATTGPIVVTTPAGTAASATDFVVTQAAAPAITSFDPAEGASGASVTITGANLASASSVKFNGVAATFLVQGETIVATVPETSATGRITVTTPGGEAVSAADFRVLGPPPPEISSFSPESGIPGDSVEIRGTNFVQVLSVRFNGVEASFTNILSDVIMASVPTNTSTGPITVITASGTNITTAVFTLPAPSLTSIDPLSGKPGDAVVLRGVNLNGLTSVLFHTNAATFTEISGTQAVAFVPADAVTGPVTVTTISGTFTSEADFVVETDPVPTDPPMLAVSLAADGKIQLSWEDDGVNYTIESNADLGAADGWAETDISTTVADGRRIAVIEPADQQRFFRLVFE